GSAGFTCRNLYPESFYYFKTDFSNILLEGEPTCVVVVSHQRVVGILTERDVVRLTAQQHSLDDVAVGRVMSHPVVSLSEAAFTEVKTAVQLCRQHRIRHLPLLGKQ
ncbi:MAG: hypothetical protein O3A14_15115, partial [Cyanobacteria bacterium]|nr:hypothetical protein [Cyanobacteriota bacterium]